VSTAWRTLEEFRRDGRARPTHGRRSRRGRSSTTRARLLFPTAPMDRVMVH
jgi:hypothetical protein